MAGVIIGALGIASTGIGLAWATRPPQELACGVRMRNCTYPLEDVNSLIEQFVDAWVQEFGGELELRKALQSLVLEWRVGDSFPYGNKTAKGLTWSKKRVELADRKITGLRSTTLTHELVHVALWVTKGDPGRQHAVPGSTWEDAHDALIAGLRKSL